MKELIGTVAQLEQEIVKANTVGLQISFFRLRYTESKACNPIHGITKISDKVSHVDLEYVR